MGSDRRRYQLTGLWAQSGSTAREKQGAAGAGAGEAVCVDISCPTRS